MIEYALGEIISPARLFVAKKQAEHTQELLIVSREWDLVRLSYDCNLQRCQKANEEAAREQCLVVLSWAELSWAKNRAPVAYLNAFVVFIYSAIELDLAAEMNHRNSNQW